MMVEAFQDFSAFPNIGNFTMNFSKTSHEDDFRKGNTSQILSIFETLKKMLYHGKIHLIFTCF